MAIESLHAKVQKRKSGLINYTGKRPKLNFSEDFVKFCCCCYCCYYYFFLVDHSFVSSAIYLRYCIARRIDLRRRAGGVI